MTRARRAPLLAAVGLCVGVFGAGDAGDARGDEAAWAIELDERIQLQPGKAAPVKLTLRGGGRHSVARSGLLVDLKPARGLGVRQRRYQRGDAVEAEASDPSFAIPVRGEALGEHALEIRVRFWVCAQKSCLPVDERRTVAIEVREPPPPAPQEPPAPAPSPPPTKPVPPAKSSPPAKPR